MSKHTFIKQVASSSVLVENITSNRRKNVQGTGKQIMLFLACANRKFQLLHIEKAYGKLKRIGFLMDFYVETWF